MNFSSYDLPSYDMNYSFNVDTDILDTGVEQNNTDIISYSILLYIGLCANIWMLWSLYKTWEKGSKHHCYLLAICIANILGLIVHCSMSIGMAVTVYWTAGNYGCKIVMTLHLFSSYLANFLLVGFNIDNFFTVINNRSARSLRVALVVMAVLAAVILSAPTIHVFGTRDFMDVTGRSHCSMKMDPMYYTFFTWAMYTGIVYLPLLLILVCGGPTLCIWCSKKDGIPYQKMKSDENGDVNMRNLGKDVAIAIAFNVVFIICWMPSGILQIYNELTEYQSFSVLVYTVAWFLSVAKSALDPIVYAVFYCCTRRNRAVVHPL